MKLYVIVRADIPAGAQCAQACHGLRAFIAAYPDEDRRWYAESNNLVVLQAPDERALWQLLERARDADVPVAMFEEPDFDDELTAIAIGPPGAKLVSNLPLALRAA
jgi:peptidyl-tRNA hydrolase